MFLTLSISETDYALTEESRIRSQGSGLKEDIHRPASENIF
jgi:hypothetical protein